LKEGFTFFHLFRIIDLVINEIEGTRLGERKYDSIESEQNHVATNMLEYIDVIMGILQEISTEGHWEVFSHLIFMILSVDRNIQIFMVKCSK
jgi:hypothetical protein